MAQCEIPVTIAIAHSPCMREYKDAVRTLKTRFMFMECMGSEHTRLAEEGRLGGVGRVGRIGKVLPGAGDGP